MRKPERDLLRRIVMECASKLQEDPSPELTSWNDWEDLASELGRAEILASKEAQRLFKEEDEG
jgi:hypothetical protein